MFSLPQTECKSESNRCGWQSYRDNSVNIANFDAQSNSNANANANVYADASFASRNGNSVPITSIRHFNPKC
jgi:hypothetical protein